jgi:hypothetical protein
LRATALESNLKYPKMSHFFERVVARIVRECFPVARILENGGAEQLCNPTAAVNLPILLILLYRSGLTASKVNRCGYRADVHNAPLPKER